MREYWQERGEDRQCGYRRGDVIISDTGRRYRFCEDAKIKQDRDFFVGAVPKAEDEAGGEFCFLKFTKASGISGVTNLRRERNFDFSYPYIAKILDEFDAVGPNGEALYCVTMDYVEGMNLEEYQKEQQALVNAGKLTAEEWERRNFRQMLEILYAMNYYTSYDQADPFLHRDLKPANIMINREGHAVLVDFDYSHTSGSRDTKNMVRGSELGMSYGYTEPRIIRTKLPDIQSEIWSMGRVFFYWLNGQDYFSDEEKRMWRQCDAFPSCADCMREIPAKDKGICRLNQLEYGLEKSRFTRKTYLGREYRLLLDMLEKMCAQPQERYTSAAEVLTDMKAFLMAYCQNSPKQYELYVEQNAMPLLQKNVGRSMEMARNVIWQYSRSGQPDGPKRGHALPNYSMRPITVDNVLLMMIYNINGILYYIPYQKELQRWYPECGFDGCIEDDFELRTGDKFTVHDIRITFWL